MSNQRPKKVLIVYFSQTGQLERVVRSVTAPLESTPAISVHFEQLVPVAAFPFPWPFLRFFDVFPECVYLDPPELSALAANPADDYDLVVLGYQPWYLSPSLPMTAFLKSPVAADLLRGKPVITIVACRNMWVMAQEEVKKLIVANGGRLIDNIVLIDQGSSGESFVTTVRWMLTGRSDRFLGLFPPAGVADSEIERIRVCGERIRDVLVSDSAPLSQPLLADLHPFEIDQKNLLPETLGRRSFRIWGWLIRRLGPPGHPARKPILLLYALFLGISIVTVVPLSGAVRSVLSRSPAFRRRMDRWAGRFQSPYSS